MEWIDPGAVTVLTKVETKARTQFPHAEIIIIIEPDFL